MIETQRNTASQIEFGPSVKVSTFIASNISGENIYSLLPIKASSALRFLYNPQEVPRRRKFKQENPGQLTAFDEASFEDSARQGIDLPPRIYEWLNKALPTDQNLTERIKTELSEEDVQYSLIAKRYFETVSTQGPETELSGKPYAINLFSLTGSFNLEGERKSKSVNLAGRFDEVRNSNGLDNIIRIRQKRGRPSTTDALYLGLDYIAYLAANKKKGSSPLRPTLSLFNLMDGKHYSLRIYSDSFFREIVNALVFSDLSLQAGYYPKEHEEGFAKIDVAKATQNSKKVQLTSNNNNRQTLTAEEVFERAKNCIKRVRGELPHTSQLFGFKEVA